MVHGCSLSKYHVTSNSYTLAIYIYPRLTQVWQHFGTLICELFLVIIRSYVDKLKFFEFSDNRKVSTIVSTLTNLKKNNLVLCCENSLIRDIEYQSPLGISDHGIIKFSYNIKCISNAYNVNRYFYVNGDYNTIKICLRKTNWYQLSDGKDVQQMWDIISEIFI